MLLEFMTAEDQSSFWVAYQKTWGFETEYTLEDYLMDWADSTWDWSDC